MKKSSLDSKSSSRLGEYSHSVDDVLIKKIIKRRKLIYTNIEPNKFEAEELKRIMLKTNNGKGCFPVPAGVQCPYCTINYYGNYED
jgi:hypothetical protein